MAERFGVRRLAAAFKRAGGALRALIKRRQSRRTPKPSTQSSRRLFVRTDTELWLDMHGRFKRWVLGPKGRATPSSDAPIHRSWYDKELPANWERGAYELIEGSDERGRFDLWFSGSKLRGEWILERQDDQATWRLRKAK